MTHVYGLYRTGKEAPNFKVFASEKDAMNSGNSFNIVKEQSCLSDVRLFPTGFLVDLYNLKAERKISKFRDRTTAEKRVWQMLIEQGMLANVETLLDQKDDKQTDEKAQHFAKKDNQTDKPRKTRKSRHEYAGKIITTTCFQNPRKKKTGDGYFSMQLIINSMDSSGGISYEDYISGGGRLQDLKWDLERGWASVDEKLDVS
jgi:hypothetical protein|tara:strand:+ start:13557 stop:14162 length:606 start_codon:yes stop_codon:yes gene_type:complete